jgi:hypothetical protein
MWKSLGKVTVPTPGTPVNVLANVDFNDPVIQALGGKPGRLSCAGILCQVFHLNQDKGYVGDRADFNKTTGLGLLAACGKPTQNTVPSAGANIPNAPGGLNAADYWVDVDAPNDGFIVSVLIL